MFHLASSFKSSKSRRGSQILLPLNASRVIAQLCSSSRSTFIISQGDFLFPVRLFFIWITHFISVSSTRLFLRRQAFKISRSYFSMVLLDERGADRERFITPLSPEELFAYTDDFLLNEEERERLELNRDVCD